MPDPKKKVVKDPQAEAKARIAREAQESIDRQKSKVNSESAVMQKFEKYTQCKVTFCATG